MNTVTFYKHNIEFQEYTFATEKEAVDCLVRHANAKDLEIHDNYCEAYSQGTIPELSIIVNVIK